MLKQKKDVGISLCQSHAAQGTALPARLLELLLTLLVCAAVLQLLTRGLGLAGLCIPWGAMAAAGLLTALELLLTSLKKQNLFFPIALGGLLVLALAGGKWVIEGVCLVWNQISAFYTTRTARLLPELATQLESGSAGLCAQLALGVLGGLLFLGCRVLVHRLRGVTAVALPLLGLAVLCLFRETAFQGWFLLVLGAALVLLLSGGGRGYQAGQIWSLLAGTLLCTVTTTLLFGLTAAPAARSWMLQVQENTREAFHNLRYETRQTALPEGSFRDFDPEETVGYTALLVTMEQPEPLYLRGFVADTFEHSRWTPVEAEKLAEDKETLYWLYKGAFYPQGQYAAAAAPLGVKTNRIEVEAVNACRKFAYAPYALVGSTAASWLDNGSLRSGTVEAEGDKHVRYESLYQPETVMDEVLALLNQEQDPAIQAFRRAESAYRDFVRKTDLQVPQDVVTTLGPALDASCSLYGDHDALTLSQAQSSALLFLSHYFGEGMGELNMPLENLAGSYYQYATVAALALRYYGVPTRYVEGYILSPEQAGEMEPHVPYALDNSCGRAWVEVYQDGLGWMPMDLTPGFEALAGQETEGGIQPVGVEGVDPNSDIGSEEGKGEEHLLSEGQEQSEEDTEENDSEDSLSGGGTMVMIRKLFRWTLLLLPFLVLALVLAVLIRKLLHDKKRRQRFADPDCAQAIGWIFAEAVLLLKELGLDRGKGSLEPVCTRAEEVISPEFGQKCREMMELNNAALFSDHVLEEEQRSAMEEFYRETRGLVRKQVRWYRRVWLVWALCRY